MNVQQFLTDQSVEFDVLEHPPAYEAQRLAQTVHTSGYEVAKTVLLRTVDDGHFWVAVLPATGQIDFEKVAQAVGVSGVELATEREVGEHCPDCELGVLPPFGSQYEMPTVVDESLTEDETIVFEANTHEEAIRMTYEDFARIEQPIVASFVY